MKQGVCWMAAQALLLAMTCRIAMAADNLAFYVVDARSDNAVVLHTTAANPPKADLPYSSFDVAKFDCCFRPGMKPGTGKVLPKMDKESPFLMSEEGKPTFQFPGYLVTSGGAMKRRSDAEWLSFGIEGMSGIVAKGKGIYVVSFPGSVKPVVVRRRGGEEGVNFLLYHASSGKKPFATYYFYVMSN